jgi:hypothetical protein
MAEKDSGWRKHSVEELAAEVERLQAEKAILQVELDKYRQEASRRHFRSRGALTWLLVLLTCVAAILAPIAVWARLSFLDVDGFTNIVAPLVADETVARSLSDEVASRLFVQLEMQKRVREALKEALPDKLDFMAGPMANSLQTLTQKIAYEVITSLQFQVAWGKILRLAHSTAVGIIRGDRSLTISRNGEVVLDAGELMGNVRDRLVGAGLGFLEKLPISSDAGEMVLFRSSQLGKMKAGMEIVDTLNYLLPLLFLVFFAAAALISEDRRRTLMWLFGALAAAMVLSLMLVNLAAGELLRVVKNPGNVGAVRIIWDRLTANLVRANLGLLILGIAGALAFAVAGPSAWARWTRRKAEELFRLQVKRLPTD